jgi:hypothetical protein
LPVVAGASAPGRVEEPELVAPGIQRHPERISVLEGELLAWRQVLASDVAVIDGRTGGGPRGTRSPAASRTWSIKLG